MDEIKLLENLVEQERACNRVIPGDVEDFNEFTLKWGKTINLILRLYDGVKDKYSEHPIVEEVYWNLDRYELPLPTEENIMEYCL